MTHENLLPLALLIAGALCGTACGKDEAEMLTLTDSGSPNGGSSAGGDAAADAGQCELDPSYQPVINPDEFTTLIDNPLFPLPVGAEWVFESEDEIIRITVTDQTYTVALGVECVVVHDEARAQGSNDLIEDTLDYYAQDAEGNVWYMGEETAEYENGQVVSTAGSWEAGVDGAQPGIIMHATPEIGQPYRQEYYACEAEDMGEVIAVDQDETVPTGSYSGCIRTRDFTPLEPAANEIKTYCPGVGAVLIVEAATGERAEELTSVTFPETDAGSQADGG